MYPEESVDDYIRSILGYPSTNNLDYSNMNNLYLNDNARDSTMQNQELEQYYPEIYRTIYPMINQKCSNLSEPVTSELIDDMVDEIYKTIETNNEFNVNINLQNSSITTNKTENRNLTRREANTQNRINPRRNNTLQDLIRILIIRELLGRPGGNRPRPPYPGRPPFLGGPGGNRPPYPGRPPIMPRDYDIFE